MPPVPPFVSEALTTVAQWFALTVAALGSAWAVRRKISSDSLQVKKDELERAWLERVQKERQEALEREREQHAEAIKRERATWELHVEDARQIAAFEVRLALLLERVERSERELLITKRLLLEARPDLGGVINSGFGDLVSRPTTKGA